MTGGEYVTKSSLTPSRLRSGSKPSGISFLCFSYTKYISNRTLTLSQGPKLKFHFLIASHVTKSLNRRLTAITKQRGSAPLTPAPLTPAGACGPWTPLSLRQSGGSAPKPPKLPILEISQNLTTGHLRFTPKPYLRGSHFYDSLTLNSTSTRPGVERELSTDIFPVRER